MSLVCAGACLLGFADGTRQARRQWILNIRSCRAECAPIGTLISQDLLSLHAHLVAYDLGCDLDHDVASEVGDR